MARLLQLGPFPLDALLLATVYINRLTHRQLAQAFKPYKFRTLFPQCLSPDPSPSQEGDHLATSSSKLSEVSPPLTPWTAHRVLLGALAIAAKYTSDAYIGQRRLAKVGGISIKELLELEFEMFKLLSWSCYTSVRELDSVCSQLWRASDRGKHSGDSVEEAQNPPYELDPLQMERLSLSPQVRQRQAISPTPAMSDGGSESSGFASSLDDISPAQISHVGRKEHNSQMWTSIAPALIPLPQ